MPQAQPLPDDLICIDCSYSLRGLTSDRCPECGLDVGFVRENRSVIPWVNRRTIGLWRAYWQTVLTLLRRPHTLCREVMKPVSYRQVVEFRRFTLLLVALGMLLGIAGWRLAAPEGLDFVRAEYGDWFIGLCCVSILIALWFMSEAASSLMGIGGVSLEFALRARTVHFYSIAPLALTPLAALIAGFVPFAFSSSNDRAMAFAVAGLLGLMVLLLLWAIYAGQLTRRLTRSSFSSVGLTVALLVLWPILLIWVGAGIPALGFLGAFLYYVFT